MVSRGGTAGEPFEGWTGVSAALIEAAERAPQVGTPLSIPFFVATGSGIELRPSSETGEWQPVREFKANVNLPRMRELFDYDKLAPLIVNTAPSEKLDPQMKAAYEAAQAALSEAVANECKAGLDKERDDGETGTLSDE
jgi:hypothetical protein